MEGKPCLADPFQSQLRLNLSTQQSLCSLADGHTKESSARTSPSRITSMSSILSNKYGCLTLLGNTRPRNSERSHVLWSKESSTP